MLADTLHALQSALGADQLSWLLNDLARVNRAVTPWVTVSWHQPPVSSQALSQDVFLGSTSLQRCSNFKGDARHFSCTALALGTCCGCSCNCWFARQGWAFVMPRCRHVASRGSGILVTHALGVLAVQLIHHSLQGGRVPEAAGGAIPVQLRSGHCLPRCASHKQLQGGVEYLL